MSKSSIQITDLLKISRKIEKDFFKSADIYSLLTLSLVTVSLYSRKKKHLTSEYRVALAVEFLPDLLTDLLSTKVITEIECKFLNKMIIKRQQELPSILAAYIYASGGLNTKLNINLESSKTCNIV